MFFKDDGGVVQVVKFNEVGLFFMIGSEVGIDNLRLIL